MKPGVDDISKVDDVVVEEGAEGDEGWDIREEHGMPEDAGGRMKHFQNEEARKNFAFEKGREYLVNFGNPYICFNGLVFWLSLALNKHLLTMVYRFLDPVARVHAKCD